MPPDAPHWLALGTVQLPALLVAMAGMAAPLVQKSKIGVFFVTHPDPKFGDKGQKENPFGVSSTITPLSRVSTVFSGVILEDNHRNLYDTLTRSQNVLWAQGGAMIHPPVPTITIYFPLFPHFKTTLAICCMLVLDLNGFPGIVNFLPIPMKA